MTCMTMPTLASGCSRRPLVLCLAARPAPCPAAATTSRRRRRRRRLLILRAIIVVWCRCLDGRSQLFHASAQPPPVASALPASPAQRPPALPTAPPPPPAPALPLALPAPATAHMQGVPDHGRRRSSAADDDDDDEGTAADRRIHSTVAASPSLHALWNRLSSAIGHAHANPAAAATAVCAPPSTSSSSFDSSELARPWRRASERRPAAAY
eukprot:COSAG01_NODE_5110_length_4475_cov_3.906764_2_plen_211_part_00